MPKRLFRCKVCGNYTLSSKSCPQCKGEVINPHPAKFSIIDKYGRYRRELYKAQQAKG